MAENNQTHRAYAYKRTGKKFGRLRWSGYGHLDTARPIEEIAAECKIDASAVRRILAQVRAHLFIEMVPYMGGTGYYCLLPTQPKPQRGGIAEPEDPRDGDDDGDED